MTDGAGTAATQLIDQDAGFLPDIVRAAPRPRGVQDRTVLTEDTSWCRGNPERGGDRSSQGR
ncbi:hypothetical protein ACIGXM_33530 [Kitasatospora sp. NPDC052896]|uniref:hypothetical protein n=1 Tax=Kitasatospora sp. NPDC052896 TaxID=3364061 RepID=UPI0037C9F691